MTAPAWVLSKRRKTRCPPTCSHTWNACPRNEKDEPGPYEASLADNPIADPERPLEVLRTVHSFDPCIACAIHVTDTENGSAIEVQAK